jgi:hypothetical protein
LIDRVGKLLLLAALLTILGVATTVIHDFDTFWQLQSGKYMVETLSIIRTDLFTLAADVPRFEHCWLHDLILYFGHQIGGYHALSVIKGLALAGTALALLWAARVRGASWPSMLLLLAPFWLSRGGWTARPQLWTFLFFALFVLILERHRRRGGKLVFLLFPLMLLWVNLHAGAILAVPILAAYLVGEGGALAMRRSMMNGTAYKMLWMAAGLVLLGFLFTPYTRELIDTFLATPKIGAAGVDAGGRSRESIVHLFNMDWRPTTFASDPYFYYGLIVTALLMAMGWRRLSLADLCLMGGLAIMGQQLSRHTSFFFFAMTAILPVYADSAAAWIFSRFPLGVKSALRWAATLAATAIFIHYALPAYHTYGLFRTGLRTWHFPVAAAEFVKEHRLPANIYNTYDWGGYLAWTLYPEHRVFWDGRQNSAEMFSYGWRVMSGHPGWEGVFEKFDVKTVVTKACTVDTGQHYPIIDQLRKDPAWRLVFADVSGLIFVREDAVAADWLAHYELPDSRADDTILSEARLLVEMEPQRYKGWWEIARIQMARKDYPEALLALEQYLRRTPQRDLQAEQLWRMLDNRMRQR